MYSDKIEEAINVDEVYLTFLFSIGNSDDGQIGANFRVIAKTPADAVEKAKEMLASQSSENRPHEVGAVGRIDVEYLSVYYNPDEISEEDIDKIETEIYDVIPKEEALKGAV